MKSRTGMDREITAKWRLQTQLVRGGTLRSDQDETSEAIFMTSGFAYDLAEEVEARFNNEAPGFVYSRQENPTVSMFQERMALIEGAERCRATGTGMAAMSSALLCQLRAGDHLVASRALFGSCRYLVDTLLPQYGIETTAVDGRDLDAWQAAVRPNTRVFFLESPANPTLDVVDIAAVSEIAHGIGARVVVDNVFATPVLQKPLALGADIVCYSATKHIDGQGRAMGGAVLMTEEFDEELYYPFYRHTGPAMSPFNAWVLLKSLETLDLRIRRMCDNAAQIADAMAERLPESVRYPGRKDFSQYELAMAQMDAGGTMITFEAPGGKKQAFAILNALEIIDISNNIGDSRSIVTHPATTTHKALGEEVRAEMGITDGMIRLSVGLEDPQDLIEDLDRALTMAGV